MDDDFGEVWPDESEPVEVWSEFAVKRGIHKSIALAMTKPQLIAALDRLEPPYDNAVH